MPLYEYQCQECGLRFERRQSFSDEPVKICPDCSGPVVRLIQPAGIIFKGSGFYVTDHRSKSSTAIPGNRKEESDDSSHKSDSEAGKAKTTTTASTSDTGGSDKNKKK